MSHQFKAAVWIHQNYQTGEPLSVELATISGESIELDFIRYMDSRADDRYVMERFNQLKAETPYNVIGHYWYCDKEYDLQIDAYVEIAIDDVEVQAIIDHATALALIVPF